ncbi:MAG: hypothetical protein Q8P36_02010 [bacterium]|nr:hypothetical protein [bacterium]
MKKPRIFSRRQLVAPEARRLDPAMCSHRAISLVAERHAELARIQQRAGNGREPRDRPEDKTEE